ncbi:MAG: sulfotransferase [Thermoplasmata archaeon]
MLEPTRSNGGRPPKRKLLYILGTGRCGSTVLEIALGSHSKIQATGEFHKTPFPNWAPESVCACGQTFNVCPFWSPIRERYREFVDFGRVQQDQLRFEKYRSLPRTLLQRLFRTRELREHARGLSELVGIIAQSSGKEVVCESSKNAVRGYLYGLSRSAQFDVYYVHLVRDGRGYIHSQATIPDGAQSVNEKPARAAWELTLRWVVPNLLAMILCSRPRNRYLRVRYEDFVERPAEILEQVGRFVGVDSTPTFQNARPGATFAIPHLIGGNRLRFYSTVTLDTRFAGDALTAQNDRWSFWAFGGWMAFQYGYLRRRRGTSSSAAPEPESEARTGQSSPPFRAS